MIKQNRRIPRTLDTKLTLILMMKSYKFSILSNLPNFLIDCFSRHMNFPIFCHFPWNMPRTFYSFFNQSFKQGQLDRLCDSVRNSNFKHEICWVFESNDIIVYARLIVGYIVRTQLYNCNENKIARSPCYLYQLILPEMRPNHPIFSFLLQL
jgi:hypothetical protein